MRFGVHAATSTWSRSRDRRSVTVPAWPSTVTTLAVPQAGGGVGEADDGGHAVLAGEDRQVAERAPGLGDEAGQARDHRREARIEVADDEHAAGRDLGRPVVHVHRRGDGPSAGPDGAAGAAAERRPRRSAATAHGRPASSRRNRAGSERRSGGGRPADRRDQRDASTHGTVQLGEREVANVVGAAQRAADGEARPELVGGARHQLLHPADAQAQRLAGDGGRIGDVSRARRMASGRVAISSASDVVVGADPRRHERQHDRFAGDELVRRDAVAPGLGEGVEGQRGAGDRCRRGRRDEQADEGLVAVQADERPLPVAQHGEQLRRRASVSSAGHRGEVGVDVVDEVDRQVGERRAQATDAPGGAQAAGRRARIELAPDAAAWRVDAEQRRGRRRRGRRRRSRARWPGRRRSATCPVSSSASRSPSRRGSSQRSCSSVDSGSGNDSATGPGPKTVPDVGGRVVIGRACRRWTRPASSTAHSTSCGPPKARPASPPRRASWRSTASGGRGASPIERTSIDPAAPVEHRRPAIGGTGHELVRPTGDGGDDDAVMATGQRVGAEQHPAPRRMQHRLDEDGHRGVDEAGAPGPVGGARGPRRRRRRTSDRSLTSRIDSNTPAIDEASPSSPVEEERTTTGTAPPSDTACQAATASSIAAGPRRRQHDAGQGRQARRPGQGQVGGLRPDQLHVGGAWVGQRDHRGAIGGFHGLTIARRA